MRRRGGCTAEEGASLNDRVVCRGVKPGGRVMGSVRTKKKIL